ncbi:MAG: DMT family transporter [Gammaproteobacteria bacterium]|nr:DMT family transporter [Gammaproteobacteria bacterium]
MSGLNSYIFYALLMLVAGLGIPVMAALNGGLGAKIQSPALATSILFIVGSVISLGYLFVSDGMPKSSPVEPIPIYFYFGGFFVIFYILSITWVAPKFGVGNAVSFVLLGQIISMAIIDHYSLLGASQNPISVQRLIGIILMVAGVFMAVRRF